MNEMMPGADAGQDPTGGAAMPPDPSMPPQDPSQMQSAPAPAQQAAPQDIHAQYAKLMQASDTLDATKASLDALLGLGDTVTPEDVVKEAGKLVGYGLSPTAVATMLVDMPQKGDMLAEWVQQQDQGVAQRVAQLSLVTNAVRHKMGVDAIQGLMVHHAQATGSPQDAVNDETYGGGQDMAGPSNVLGA